MSGGEWKQRRATKQNNTLPPYKILVGTVVFYVLAYSCRIEPSPYLTPPLLRMTSQYQTEWLNTTPPFRTQ
jgi:hypothetical protein